MSLITYKYRIKDTVSKNKLNKMSYSVNYIWNYCQEISLLAIHRDKFYISAYDLHKLTTGVSKDLCIHAGSIQQVCTEYVIRRKQYKKIKLKWRSRKRSLGWIPFKSSSIKIKGNTITYCGYDFRLWLSRPIIGKIKTGSFTQDSRGRWYINLNCEIEDLQEPVGIKEIGIDLGLKNQIVCSDGIIYNRENLIKKHENALAMSQRAHKKNRIKSIHAKIANCRKDWNHKTTTKIVQDAKYIVIGNVSSSKLSKTKFSKSVYDSTWYTIRFQLTYKAKRLAGICISGNEKWSSVTCSVCNQRTGPSGLSMLGVREWACSNCGITHDRDVNAAKNILAFSPYGAS